MGRPPIGKQAMSGAERQRRYLTKLLAGNFSATLAADEKDLFAKRAKAYVEAIKNRDREIAALKTRIAELEDKAKRDSAKAARIRPGKLPR
jgi:hypothetical protein